VAVLLANRKQAQANANATLALSPIIFSGAQNRWKKGRRTMMDSRYLKIKPLKTSKKLQQKCRNLDVTPKINTAPLKTNFWGIYPK